MYYYYYVYVKTFERQIRRKKKTVDVIEKSTLKISTQKKNIEL